MSLPSLIDAFNAAVYLQPFIWLLLYTRRIVFSLNLFYAIGFAAALGVSATGLSVGHYPAEIILVYVLMTIYTVHHYRGLGSMKATCLGFLLVFMNSYFWEFPLHLENLLVGGSLGVQAVQVLHLMPLPFLLNRVKGDLVLPSRLTVVDLSLNVFIFTCVMVWLQLWLPYYGLGFLNHASRAFSLLTLIKIFGLKRDKYPEINTMGGKVG